MTRANEQDFGDTQSDPIVLKIFPPHILKNNFSRPHIGTFAKPHKPTHDPSFAKEPISHAQKKEQEFESLSEKFLYLSNTDKSK